MDEAEWPEAEHRGHVEETAETNKTGERLGRVSRIEKYEAR